MALAFLDGSGSALASGIPEKEARPNARRATLRKGDWDQFDRALSGSDFTAEDVLKLNRHPEVLATMLETMRAHPVFLLIHGRFAPLAEKLEMVKGYPGMTVEAVAAALAEFEQSGRRQRYEEESPKNPLLDAVVAVYRATVPETLLYARDRMAETFGDSFAQWEEAYGSGVDDHHVRLLEGIPDHRNTVRIEVVDLGAHFDPKNGFNPKDARNLKSASFAVLYAAAQSPEWPRQMNGTDVPYALAGGLELNVPGRGPWARLPGVWRGGGQVELRGGWVGSQYHGSSLPSLWE